MFDKGLALGHARVMSGGGMCRREHWQRESRGQGENRLASFLLLSLSSPFFLLLFFLSFLK
jgi:hypothetical protein